MSNTDDPRTGTIIEKGDHGDVVIMYPFISEWKNEWFDESRGFPYDEGVQRNGGRVGSAKGPSTARMYVIDIDI